MRVFRIEPDSFHELAALPDALPGRGFLWLGYGRRAFEVGEASVQMHFSAPGHRTNSVMRTLTVLTAVFLPLNLITGIFGMIFEWMSLIHNAGGFWHAAMLMLAVALGLWFFFRSKRYLGSGR